MRPRRKSVGRVIIPFAHSSALLQFFSPVLVTRTGFDAFSEVPVASFGAPV